VNLSTPRRPTDRPIAGPTRPRSAAVYDRRQPVDDTLPSSAAVGLAAAAAAAPQTLFQAPV